MQRNSKTHNKKVSLKAKLEVSRSRIIWPRLVANYLYVPHLLAKEKRPRITMQSTNYPSGWPARIKFAANWPTATSRLGDIGYIDNSGIWRTVLNVLDSDQCRADGVEPLRLVH